MNQTELYDVIQNDFDRRYRQKKRTNLAVSILIVLLGVSSFLYGLTLESIKTIFRLDDRGWNGVYDRRFRCVHCRQSGGNNQAYGIDQEDVFFIRLSCAVAESTLLYDL